VFSLFLDGCGNVRGCVRPTHTHTHTARVVLGCEPRGRIRHLEGPKNPDGLNLGIYVFLHVCKVHMWIYVLGGGMRSWTN